MSTDECAKLASALHKAIVAENIAAQEDLYQRLDLEISDHLFCPEECFRALLDAIADDAIAKVNESSRLIKLFEYNLDILDSSQVSNLYQSLESAYPGFVDPASLILILELLVAGHDSQESLDMLQRLTRKSKIPARALLPYGLQYLCKISADGQIFEKVISSIQLLLKDPSKDVRNEAEMASERIKKMAEGN